MKGSAAFVAALLAVGVLQASAMYDGKSNVVTLTQANFRETVVKSPHTWIVEFYAPWCGHCQRLAPDYEKVAGNLKGLVGVGAVDCNADANKPLCGQYGIEGFPTIKVFEAGKSSPVDYQGARSPRAIVDFALERMPSKVVKVSAASIDTFFATDADTSSHILLFSSKPKTAPLFKAVSVDFAGAAVFGEVKSSEKALAERFGVTTFPTLLAFPKGGAQDAPIKFTGALNQEEVRAFLAQHSPPVKTRRADKSAPPPPPPPKEEPIVAEPAWTPEVAELRTQEDLERECLDRPIGLCLIAFLDVQQDDADKAAENAEYVKTLEAVKAAAHDKGRAHHIMWANAHTQEALRRSFDLSDQLPGALLLAPRKNRFRPFLGAFDERSLTEFLNETKARTFSYTHKPTIA